MGLQKPKAMPGKPTAVRFVADYRGVLTDEQFYQIGEVAEFPQGNAQQLVDDGRAEFAKPGDVLRNKTEPDEPAEGGETDAPEDEAGAEDEPDEPAEEV